MYFRVRTSEGKRFILRYNESEDEWTLQSGFDGDELLARPSVELITIGDDVIRRAEKKSSHAGTATLPMPKFHSTGF